MVTLSTSASDHGPVHVILFGNPGVGKSTLLNALTATKACASGPSLCGGLTVHAQSVTVGRTVYTDTPGLDDAVRGQLAATALSQALTAHPLVKLVFVTTLAAGHVKSADVLSLRLTLDALVSAGIPDVSSRYAVWVNKASIAELRQIHSSYRPNEPLSIRAQAQTLKPIAEAFAYKGITPCLHVIPQVTAAAGTVNATLPRALVDELHTRLDQIATLTVPPNSIVEIMPVIELRAAVRAKRKARRATQSFRKSRPYSTAVTAVVAALAVLATATVVSNRAPSAPGFIRWIVSYAIRALRPTRTIPRVQHTPVATLRQAPT